MVSFLQQFLMYFQTLLSSGVSCCTHDANNSISHVVCKHLEDPEAHVCLMFIDFISAFNSLQPHIVIQKWKHMNANPFHFKMVLFLFDRLDSAD